MHLYLFVQVAKATSPNASSETLTAEQKAKVEEEQRVQRFQLYPTSTAERMREVPLVAL